MCFRQATRHRVCSDPVPDLLLPGHRVHRHSDLNVYEQGDQRRPDSRDRAGDGSADDSDQQPTDGSADAGPASGCVHSTCLCSAGPSTIVGLLRPVRLTQEWTEILLRLRIAGMIGHLAPSPSLISLLC